MTERLYYDDSYLTEFDGHVLACEPEGDRWRVLLDRSAFYPTSGGQPFDTGTLGGARVLDVNVAAGEVWHTVDAPLDAGCVAHGVVDWPRRFDHMQQHAADHMIASALHRLMHGVTIGLHVGAEVSTIDVRMPDGATRISDEDIRRVEADVNERVQRDVPVRAWFPSDAELKTLPLRKAPTVSEHVRIVAIGTDEMVACGGTHPSTAGQIGPVKITQVTPARGLMRVEFLAGMRAFADYQRSRRAAYEAANAFSTNLDGLMPGILSMQARLKDVEDQLRECRRRELSAEAERLVREAEPVNGMRLACAMLECGDAALLRETASRVIHSDGMAALLGTRADGKVLYVFAHAADVSFDAGALMRASGGRGGGKPDFAQGSGPEQVLAAARAKLTEGF